MGKVFNLALGSSDITYELESIEILTMPNKIEYTVGEEFDPSGMQILANYVGGASGVVTGYSYSPHILDISTTEITVVYAINNISKSVLIPITVNELIAGIPAQSETLTYNGSAQSPSWSNYDTNLMSIDSEPSATNAGTYASTFTLKQYAKWIDGTKEPKTVNWAIGKATGYIRNLSSSISLDGPIGSQTYITCNSSGVVNAYSSNTSIARVSVSGTTIYITSVSGGQININVQALETENYTASNVVQCLVTVTIPTWKEVQRYTTAGTYTFKPSYTGQKYFGAIIIGGGFKGEGTSRYYKKGGDGGKSGGYIVVKDISYSSSGFNIVVGAKNGTYSTAGASSAFGTSTANAPRAEGGTGVDNADGNHGQLIKISNPFGANIYISGGGAGGGAYGGIVGLNGTQGGSGNGYGGNGGKGGEEVVNDEPGDGAPAVSPGCGGGGGGAAYTTNSSYYSAGGDGADGMVIIYEYK